MSPDKPSSDEMSSGKQEHKLISTIADVILKLGVASAAVFAAIVANTYQSKMTAVNILSQREYAESTLRSTMFSNLIGPIAGPYKDGKEISPERETLLVELLALNFHDHFEFKPLLEFVDDRLKKTSVQRGKEKEAKEAGESLRSISRRVIDRQIASLLKEGSTEDRTEVHQLIFISEATRSEFKKKFFESLSERKKMKYFEKFFECPSPDGAWKLNISVKDVDQKGNVTVMYNVINLLAKNYEDVGNKKFTITPYDFPLTDNTLLADGNRFAVTLEDIEIDKTLKTVYLRLIWFPKNYFTARERPMNYNEFREKLGLQAGGKATQGTEFLLSGP
jgi:hypothetical protein